MSKRRRGVRRPEFIIPYMDVGDPLSSKTPCPPTPAGGYDPLPLGLDLAQRLESRARNYFPRADPQYHLDQWYSAYVAPQGVEEGSARAYKDCGPKTFGELKNYIEDIGYRGAMIHSDWEENVFANPKEFRPPLAVDILEDAQIAVAVAGVFTTIAFTQLPEDHEGVLLQLAGEDLTGGALPAVWRLLINGRQLVGLSQFTGAWSSLTFPRRIIKWLRRNALVQLQVSVPTAPRTVQATLQGWSSPTRGGGAVASGYVRA